MRARTRPRASVLPRAAILGAALGIATFALASPALAATSAPARHDGAGGAGHAVFVQTDNTAGNEVVAYRRSGSGTLTEAGAYSAGGLGGILSGSVVDHLASQGSLVLDRRAAC